MACMSCHFLALEQLRVHLRRHKGVRKFECVDCGYKFTRQVGFVIKRPFENATTHQRSPMATRPDTLSCTFPLRKAHLRRHSLIHKRMENYNPKQRKLRNLIVEGQAEGEATQPPKASTLSTTQDPLSLALPIPEDPSQQLTLSDPGLDPDGLVPVVMQAADLVVMEDGASNKAQGGGDGGPGNIVPVSGVLQQNQLEPGSYTTVVVL